MDPGFVHFIGSRDTLSPQASEIESLDGLDGDEEQNEEGLPEDNTDLLSSSRALNFVGATIRDASYPGDGGLLEPRGAPSIVLPHQEATYVRHIALDIGGSLIKLVYFSPDPECDSSNATCSNSSSSSSSTNGDEGGGGNGGGGGASAANGAGGGASADGRKVEGTGGSNGSAAPLPPGQGAERQQHQNHPKGGRIHFVKFETARIGDCLDFIEAKGLHRCLGRDGFQHETRVKATGGGAHRFADMFKERLGLVIEKEDEISCAVGGCNFLLRAISHEAFTFTNGSSNFLTFPTDADLYPYLLVNIGSGVSIIKVDGDGQYTRISGSSVGGGTFWGLCSLLTGKRDFDEILALSATGNNANVDMLVGDIYGGRDYSAIGLSATTIASSFGKVVGDGKSLEEYSKADIAMALCRMISYNIGQLAYMNAKHHGLKRVFFGGFFIRGHPYTMDTISFAIKFWSQGEMNALFLRHEGFLGAVGAFLKVHPMHIATPAAAPGAPPGGRPNSGRPNSGVSRAHRSKVLARFVERFSMGAPFAGGEVHGPVIKDMSDRVSWVEKFVAAGAAAQEAAATEQKNKLPPVDVSLDRTTSNASASGGGDQPPSPGAYPASVALHVGVLHYSPTWEPFPLLSDLTSYEPNTVDINADEADYLWLLKVLKDQIPTVVEKAIASEGGGDGPRRRAMAFARAFSAHLAKLLSDPGCYGQIGLGELFEMREECLREFGFSDVYRLDKERENAVALQVLPDLLAEMDGLPPRERLLSLVQGILAANIFDWGARACVELYTNGTILDIYREARRNLANRPWRVDDFDAFCDRVYGPRPGPPAAAPGEAAPGEGPAPVAPDPFDEVESGRRPPPFRRVMIFVDNAGADVVLGMLPFLRELLRLRCEVVLVANSLPAINDITAAELRGLLSAAAEVCPVIKAARQAAKRVECGAGIGPGTAPPYPGLGRRQPSLGDLAAHGAAAAQQQQQQQHHHHHHNHHAAAASFDGGVGPAGGGGVAAGSLAAAVEVEGDGVGAAPAAVAGSPGSPSPPSVAFTFDRHTPGGGDLGLSMWQQQPARGPRLSGDSASSGSRQGEDGTPRHDQWQGHAHQQQQQGAARPPEARLFVVAGGNGGPCLDLRRVPATLADATVGVDLLVIEGMGRAVYTNLHAAFKCDSLKLAMIKTERLARKLFNGTLYDCVCLYQPGTGTPAGALVQQQQHKQQQQPPLSQQQQAPVVAGVGAS